MAEKPGSPVDDEPLSIRRKHVAQWISSGFPAVARFQQLCGVEDETGGHPVLHAIFTFGAALGDEILFAILLPGLFWYLDLTVGRRVVTVWAFAYWTGQVLKDYLRLPRPHKDVVIQLENHYAAEYGMPSTHAMNAIFMPLYILYLVHGRTDAGATVQAISVIVALSWVVLCTLSRLYMGVHCVADIVVGLFIGLCCLALGISYGPLIDNLILTSWWSWICVPMLCCGAVAIYPRPTHWVNSPGDTAVIIGGTCVAAITYPCMVVSSVS